MRPARVSCLQASAGKGAKSDNDKKERIPLKKKGYNFLKGRLVKPTCRSATLSRSMPASRDALLRGSQLPPDWVQTGCCSNWHVDADQMPPTDVHTLWLEMAAQQTKGGHQSANNGWSANRGWSASSGCSVYSGCLGNSSWYTTIISQETVARQQTLVVCLL